MTAINKSFSFQGGYDELLCQKISLAIKKSNVFAHINPSDLIRKRFSKNSSISDVPPKKYKTTNILSVEAINDNKSCKENICLSPISMKDVLPDPVSLFQSTLNCDNKAVVKAECVVEDSIPVIRNLYEGNKANPSVSQSTDPDKELSFTKKAAVITSVSNVSACNNNSTNLNQSFISDKGDKSPKREVNREKHNKDLSNLAVTLLPLPTQLFGKDSMLIALEKGNHLDFLNFFKEGIQMETEISVDDFSEIIEMIVKKKAFTLMPGFLNCIKNVSLFIEPLIDSFLKYKNELDKFKNDILRCIESMIGIKNELHLNLFVKFCIAIKSFDKIFPVISKKMSIYVMPDSYFCDIMSLFEKLDGQKPSINNEMLMNIISYITRAYPSKKSEYLIEIWLYCMYYDINNKELNSIKDIGVFEHVIDKVIDKLNKMKDPSFIFGMRLLSKNWNLIFNDNFCDWFSKLISDKNDVRKCLFTIKDSIHALNRNGKQDVFDSFYLLAIRVMSYLNKKSLFTCSKNVYENFLKNYFPDIKRGLSRINDKFKLKWTMVECLVSSAEYEKALSVIKEFEVLKDLETTSADYNRVKEILPNLVWHLINSADMLPVITLFEQVISIFIFNESIDRAYTKNCNEIFDLIVIKAFESKNIEVVKKMISLLDLILSADINFEISKKSLRYLAVAAVRTNIPFKELLDFVDVCFKFNVFENIESSDDGFGSFVNANSNLTFEEIVLLITWTCRHVKIKLVQSVQNQGSSIRENIMKVCSIKFFLHSSTKPDSFCKELKMETSLNEFLIKFTEALNNPKYLKHPIKFSTISDTSDNVMKIVCDNRIVYNTIYYSDI